MDCEFHQSFQHHLPVTPSLGYSQAGLSNPLDTAVHLRGAQAQCLAQGGVSPCLLGIGDPLEEHQQIGGADTSVADPIKDTFMILFSYKDTYMMLF
jgi:hypothetical protein